MKYEDVQTATDDFKSENVIGKGGQGKVYRGLLKGKVVAIKEVQNREKLESRDPEQFLFELTSMAAYEHDNITRLLGFHIKGACDCFYMVMEFVENGTLHGLLHPNQGQGQVPLPTLSWKQRIHIAVGIARALSFLHTHPERPLLYRDMKSRNILVDGSYNAKLCNFGISTICPPEGRLTSGRLYYTPYYMDTEYVKTGIYSRHCDVFQFGVVLFELISGLDAKLDLHAYGLSGHAKKLMGEGKVMDLLDPNLNLMGGSLTDEEILQFKKVAELAYQCMAEQLESRPTAEDAQKVLEDLERRVNPEEPGPSSI